MIASSSNKISSTTVFTGGSVLIDHSIMAGSLGYCNCKMERVNREKR
jgi:hypothetical protein